MALHIFHHPSSLEHDTGRGHPERPDRVRAVIEALRSAEFAAARWHEAPRAEVAHLTRVHRPDYVEALLAAVPREGRVMIDGDTVMSSGSGEAALTAAGAVVAAVDAVLAGDPGTTAFCAVRPPGHHAEPERGMGFCLFNNVAVGAAHARSRHGLARVAVVDFDVHHGNGTQAAFEHDSSVFFASSHEYPLYPGTGHARERGVGNIVNVPLAPSSGSSQFRAAWRDAILPALVAFEPGLILVSAGFDAHARDPLATLQLGEDDFAWLTAELVAVADRVCAGRIVSTLEGGYDLAALGASAAAHARVLGGTG
ncbi:MAG: histone deacetylase family protein [Alphaproteobacteria bacterium]|nr:histone deacetylase family protein [Alphaproteobacteria bacterium]